MLRKCGNITCFRPWAATLWTLRANTWSTQETHFMMKGDSAVLLLQRERCGLLRVVLGLWRISCPGIAWLAGYLACHDVEHRNTRDELNTCGRLPRITSEVGKGWVWNWGSMQFTRQLESHSNTEFCPNLARYEPIRCRSDAIKITADWTTQTEVHLIACLNFLPVSPAVSVTW